MDKILEFNDWSQVQDQLKLDKEISLLESSDLKSLEEDEREWVEKFLVLFAEHNCTIDDIYSYYENPTNESVLGSILGGLTGFALGKRIGKVIAKVLGVEKGVLYDLLTSRLVGAAIGSNVTKRII